VDATIINSSNRPLSDKKRTSLEPPSSQVDTDADATCEGGTWYFGYKGHIGMDAGSKLIRQISFTPASTHDSQLLADLVSEDERSLFGDKAYSNDSVKHQGRQSGWQVGILDNPKKSHSLSVSQKKRNKRHRRMHRQVRARLLFDQGSLWHAPGSIQDRTTQPGQFMMKSICWNIERSMQFAKKERKIKPARAC